eukprot:CAMPEP_0177384526 /NCGR_PEP_ID=MMETSP0368-20130122/49745_1 /TAXON_ID=447022 ORGANISM="Scrippsiella hangoei-like, Strain SHHI-4" /NCGR_SAMPLE_ID=MMETSP0368 /ASSEMBLY_ACC=CAM_ASM_000363 /LENGTH=71 /DNA_ID=CAMNT_0018849209 /DNA_START=265 /DNA_END=476 /DNA_ORIENTATION=+
MPAGLALQTASVMDDIEVPMQATFVSLACCGAPVGCGHTIDIVLVVAIGPNTALVVSAGGFHALQVALAAR